MYYIPNAQGHSKKDYFTDVNIFYFLQSNFTFSIHGSLRDKIWTSQIQFGPLRFCQLFTKDSTP